jgi:hypothetical protein
MSFYDYQASKELDANDVPFYALIMVAMPPPFDLTTGTQNGAPTRRFF